MATKKYVIKVNHKFCCCRPAKFNWKSFYCQRNKRTCYGGSLSSYLPQWPALTLRYLRCPLSCLPSPAFHCPSTRHTACSRHVKACVCTCVCVCYVLPLPTATLTILWCIQAALQPTTTITTTRCNNKNNTHSRLQRAAAPGRALPKDLLAVLLLLQHFIYCRLPITAAPAAASACWTSRRATKMG